MIDLHNHLIPGVDDGARDLDDARAALGAFRDAGVTTVVCTPHFDGALTRRPEAFHARMAELDRGWEALRTLAPEFPDLALHRGVELRLDIPDPDLSDPRVRLAGSSAVLVEFDAFAVPPGAADVIRALADGGIVPVLAHPERYRGASVDTLAALADAGARLQVNAGSLAGFYGDRARDAAGALLDGGLATLLSSDYHARGPLHTPAARAAVAARLGEEATALLLETNARRLLDDRLPLSVAGKVPEPGGWLARVAAWVRRQDGPRGR